MNQLLAKIVVMMFAVMVTANVSYAGYLFTYTDNTGNHAFGTLETTKLTSNPYAGLELITSGSLTLFGSGDVSAYDGVYTLAPGGPNPVPNGFFFYDNLLFPLGNSSVNPNGTGMTTGSGYLDFDGMMFTKGTGTSQLYAGIWFLGPYQLGIGGANGDQVAGGGQIGSMTLTAVPEPSSLVVVAIGMGCLMTAYGYRRRLAAGSM